jgi:hypothetical protein
MNQIAKREDIFAQGRGIAAGSEAAKVEHTRAIAEVMGALKVAQSFPRDEVQATQRVLDACRQRAVAERAFFKFPRGGSTVEGESIHLAVELARCWGNIEHKIMELDRDDGRGMSEMLAVAWDLETNTRAVMGFLVPHKRDKRGGAEALTDLRDIYENNANQGARRVRECIFRVLPKWLIEQAVDECRKTLASNTDGKPLQVRIAEALAAFEKMGIKADRIEAKLGPSAKWTETDLAGLKVSYRSINNREVSIDEEFPPIVVDQAKKLADEIRKTASQQTPGVAVAANPAEDPPSPKVAAEPGAAVAGEDDPREAVKKQIIADIEAKKTVIDVNALLEARANDIEAMPDEMAGEIKAAADAQMAKLKGGK